MCTVVTTQVTLIKLHQISVFQFVNSSEFLRIPPLRRWFSILWIDSAQSGPGALGFTAGVRRLGMDLSHRWRTVDRCLFFGLKKAHSTQHTQHSTHWKIHENMMNMVLSLRDPRHQRGLQTSYETLDMLPQWSPPYLAIFKALMKLLSYLKTSSHERIWEVPVLSTLAPSTLCREHFSENFWGCDSEGWNCWTAQILPMSWAKWHWGGNQLHFAAARCFSESGATHWWNWGALERRSFLQKNHVETLHLDLRPCLKHAPFRPFWPFWPFLNFYLRSLAHLGIPQRSKDFTFATPTAHDSDVKFASSGSSGLSALGWEHRVLQRGSFLKTRGLDIK